MELEHTEFKIVGTDYKAEEKSVQKQRVVEKLRGKPILSILILILIIGGCLFAEKFYNHDPSDFYLQNLNEAPNAEFYFGTDSLGRDIYSMIWYGGRASILIGLLSMCIITVIGVTYGCISGMCNEKVDAVMMRFAELLNSIPSLLLVLLLVAITGEQNIVKISIVIGITSWFGLARIVRSEVRQIRSSDYVLAARCMGGNFSM